MGNPHYDFDLAIAERDGNLDRAISAYTIFIVVGGALLPELLDRPVAEWLRDEIDLRGKLGQGKRAVIITDLYWYKDPSVRAHSVISVGGPLVNALTAELMKRAESSWHTEGVHGCFSAGPPPAACLWGDGPTQTRLAVKKYIEQADGLAAFLKFAWG